MNASTPFATIHEPTPHQGGARRPRHARLACAAGLALALGLGAGLPAHAQSSEVYVCSGPNGVPEYRNGPGGKGCKRLNLPDVMTVPGVRTAPAARGGNAPAANAANAGNGAAVAGFPRVDSATQRSRDNDRRAVLEHELQAEEAKLAALRAEYNNGEPERQGNERNYQKYLDRTNALRDDIARTEANAASLRRELANMRN